MNINPVRSTGSWATDSVNNEKSASTPALKGDTREATATVMLEHIARMKQNISHWQGDAHTTWDDSWKKRFEDTEHMLELFSALMNNAQSQQTEQVMAQFSALALESGGQLRTNTTSAKELHFAHFLENEPVGLLTLFSHADENTAYINCMVAHPGSAGAGSLLIEKAVNQSELWNYQGRVALDTIIGPTAQAHQNIGFEWADDVNLRMNLDPRNSDKWEQHGGVWQLRR